MRTATRNPLNNELRVVSDIYLCMKRCLLFRNFSWQSEFFFAEEDEDENEEEKEEEDDACTVIDEESEDEEEGDPSD